MQEHEYKARDKTVRKMNRDGLTEENLQTGETVRVSQREREERILPKQAEDVPFSRSSRNPDDLTERKEPRKKPKDSLEEEQGEMIPSSVSDGGGVSSSKDFVWPSDSLIAEHWTEKPEMEPDGEPETASSSHAGDTGAILPLRQYPGASV